MNLLFQFTFLTIPTWHFHNQRKYAYHLLQKSDFQDSSPTKTPMETPSNLCLDHEGKLVDEFAL